MQLKRDTDYALRILFCLKDTLISDTHTRQKSIPLTKLSSEIKVPKITTKRICDSLVEKGLIHVHAESGIGGRTYYVTHFMLKHSLLDVVEAVEHTGKIFAVFDKSSYLYKQCENALERAQGEYEKLLADTLLEQLLEEDK